MSALVRAAALALALAGAGTLLAQAPEPPEEEAAAAPEARSPGDEPAGGDAGEGGESAGRPAEDFIPSERVPADASIAFPVDI